MIYDTSRPEYPHGTIVYTYDTLRCAASASAQQDNYPENYPENYVVW